MSFDGGMSLMRTMRGAALCVALAGALAMPAGAAAQANGDDCSYTTTGNPAAGVQAGAGGMTGDGGTTAVGACVNAPTPEGTFQGGSVEIGTGGNGSYAVIDGDNQNSDPGDGYMGLST